MFEPAYASASLTHSLSVEYVPVLTAEATLVAPVVDEPFDADEVSTEPDALDEGEDQGTEEESDSDSSVEADSDTKTYVNLFSWTAPVKETRKREETVVELLPLTVKSSHLNETGTLFVSFSKPIYIPDKLKLFEVKVTDPGFDSQIKEVISLEVVSSYFDEGAEETAINDYRLRSFDSSGFTVDVEFKSPLFITQSLTE